MRFYLQPGNEQISLGKDRSIDIAVSSFPYERNKFKSDCLWEVELLAHDQDTGYVKLKVTDYHANELEAFQRQILPIEIECIEFEPFVWQQLEPCLHSHQKASLSLFLVEPDSELNLTAQLSEVAEYEKEPDLGPELYKEEEPKAKVDPYASLEKHPEFLPEGEQFERRTINYPIAEIRFGEGFGEVKLTPKHISDLARSETRNLINPAIKKEFEPIKLYIARSMGKRKIKLHLELKRNAWQKTELLHVSSEEFESLSSGSIEEIHLKFVKERLSQLGLWELSESFAATEEKQANNEDANKTESNRLGNLINYLLKGDKPLHSNELQWLSQKQTIRKGQKLKFFDKPDPAFLFYIESKDCSYFILETYEADRATYIWRYPFTLKKTPSQKQIKAYFELIDAEIARIDEIKRSKYRRTAPDNFSFIDHPAGKKGFSQWKADVHSKLGIEPDL